MKSSDTDDFAEQADARIIPSNWIKRSTGASEQPARTRDGSGQWLTTLPSPLDRVREAALTALSILGSPLACLHETAEKIVIRSSLGGCQIRSEMTSIDPETTRIVVVSMHGDDVDRRMSTAVVAAIKLQLEQSPTPP